MSNTELLDAIYKIVREWFYGEVPANVALSEINSLMHEYKNT